MAEQSYTRPIPTWKKQAVIQGSHTRTADLHTPRVHKDRHCRRCPRIIELPFHYCGTHFLQLTPEQALTERESWRRRRKPA